MKSTITRIEEAFRTFDVTTVEPDQPETALETNIATKKRTTNEPETQRGTPFSANTFTPTMIISSTRGSTSEKEN